MEALEHPQEHFYEIKTKINLKVTKQYHEYVERTKSEERKARQTQCNPGKSVRIGRRENL